MNGAFPKQADVYGEKATGAKCFVVQKYNMNAWNVAT